jgi:hypothetical protein
MRLVTIACWIALPPAIWASWVIATTFQDAYSLYREEEITARAQEARRSGIVTETPLEEAPSLKFGWHMAVADLKCRSIALWEGADSHYPCINGERTAYDREEHRKKLARLKAD